MTLIVEDGTGLANAESYLSVTDWTTRLAALGYTLTSTTEAKGEAALRRGTRYIDGTYAQRWPGQAVNGRDQALDWPRLYVVDSFGFPVASDEVPTEILEAVTEAAYREHEEPNSLVPDVTGGQRVISETVGPISIRYSDKGDPTVAATPVVPLIDQLLYPLLVAGGSSVHWLRRA